MGVLEHLKGVLKYTLGVLHACHIGCSEIVARNSYLTTAKEKNVHYKIQKIIQKGKHTCSTYNSMSNSFSHILSSVLQSCKAAFGICCLSFISKIKCCTNTNTFLSDAGLVCNVKCKVCPYQRNQN